MSSCYARVEHSAECSLVSDKFSQNSWEISSGRSNKADMLSMILKLYFKIVDFNRVDSFGIFDGVIHISGVINL